MPRSVSLLSSDPHLFQSVRNLLGPDARFIVTDAEIQVDRSSAPHMAIYPVGMDPVEWDDWDSKETEMPDPRTMSHLILECRSPEWVAEVGRLLAQGLRLPLWLVDAEDTAWPAGKVDPVRIALA